MSTEPPMSRPYPVPGCGRLSWHVICEYLGRGSLNIPGRNTAVTRLEAGDHAQSIFPPYLVPISGPMPVVSVTCHTLSPIVID